jgi:fatty acid desaturase
MARHELEHADQPSKNHMSIAMVDAANTTSRPALYTAAVRRRLAPELLVASRLRGYGQSAVNVAVYVALLFAASAASSAWQFVVLYVAIGFALHRLFFPLHDCIHYSLFPTKIENRVVGAFLSALLGTSFDAIRDQHLAHHRDFGSPDDPGAPDYFPRFRSRRQLIAFLVGPLVGTILFAKLGDYLTRPSRTSAAEGTPPARRTSRGTRRTSSASWPDMPSSWSCRRRSARC